MKKFVKNMLEYSSEKIGINYDKMQEYCKMYANDRRYKPYFAGSTCSWNYNQHGFIVYRGVKYYFKQCGSSIVYVE